MSHKENNTSWRRENSYWKNVFFFVISDNIDLNAVMSQQNPTPSLLAKNVDNQIEEEDPEGTVKPS